MTQKEKIHNYLDESSSQKLANGNLDFGSRNQVAENATLKKKQLFMMFMETVEAPEALREFAVQSRFRCVTERSNSLRALFGRKRFFMWCVG
ncbi:hypothetical protein O9929_11930 [Vibrio lentus]|nr:hypothetical protein [Vibrio lentus]